MGASFRASKHRHLVCDGKAITFECDYFPGMIGEHAQSLQAEVDQDLCANATFMLQQTLPRKVLIDLAARVIQNMRQHAGRGSSGSARAWNRFGGAGSRDDLGIAAGQGTPGRDRGGRDRTATVPQPAIADRRPRLRA